MNNSLLNASKLKQTDIILIDNFDSFTYNLVNQLKPLVRNLNVFRNTISLEQLIKTELKNNDEKIFVLSPGPGNPDGAGITLEIIEHYKGVIPILGICLGHQAIVQSYLGVIGSAKKIIHGKSCDILFDEKSSIFAQLESPFRAARYHSLAASKVPNSLKVIATCDDEVMAVVQNRDKVLGFQFHPESILTPKGGQLMKQSLEWLVQKNACE
jgi:anthranilate synthase component 2